MRARYTCGIGSCGSSRTALLNSPTAASRWLLWYRVTPCAMVAASGRPRPTMSQVASAPTTTTAITATRNKDRRLPPAGAVVTTAGSATVLGVDGTGAAAIGRVGGGTSASVTAESSLRNATRAALASASVG